MTKREKILFNRLSECRNKLRIERRVTEHFRSTRAQFQLEFSKAWTEMKEHADLLREHLNKVAKERDTLKAYQIMAVKREQALRVHLNAARANDGFMQPKGTRNPK